MKALSCVLGMVLCLTPCSLGGEAPAARPERKIALSEVVRLALAHNLRLAIAKIDPKKADTVIVEQTAIFDPTATSSLSTDKVRHQAASGFSPTLEKHSDGSAGVSKLFPLGTTVDVHFGATRDYSNLSFPGVDILNPAYGEEWGITFVQPVLRGFGVRVNTSGIAVARNERRIVQKQLRKVALDTVADAEKSYWLLVFTLRNHELLKRSLARAENLLRDVQARVDAKVLGQRDPSVAQARAEVATRREEVIVAQNNIHNAEEALKVITNLGEDPAAWDVALIPADEPPENIPVPSVQQAVDTALARRPDYQAAQLAVDTQDIQLYLRNNELLPKLNFVAGTGHTGLGNSFGGADRKLRSLDWYSWSVGVNLEYPIGNHAARARYRRASFDRQQAVLDVRALALQIQLEVRNAVRQVATNAERLVAVAAAVQAEEERLRAEEIRFLEAHVGTSQDVLDAQAALAQAESRRLQALIELNNAAADVERLKGTLLEARNVVFEED